MHTHIVLQVQHVQCKVEITKPVTFIMTYPGCHGDSILLNASDFGMLQC